MDRDQALEFLRTNSRCVLATTRRDGHPQLSPVDVTVNAQGQVVLSSRQTAVKVKNLRRTPYASVCAFTENFYGPWCQVEGPVHVVELPEAMEGLVDYYRRAAGKEHPDWDDYRQAMVREQRVLVVIDVERTGPSVSG
jgi:PPOX class probable F420-dependent enzyme